MKISAPFLFFFAVSGAFAAAEISNVAIDESDTRLVKITYDLSGSAVVTADILTNGVSIGAANCGFMVGAVNRKIAEGTGKTIYWAADKAWPGHRFTDATLTARITAWEDNDPPDWMVVDLRATNQQEVAFYVVQEQIPQGVTNRLYKDDVLAFRRVRAKGVEWIMGSPSNEVGRTSVNNPYYENTRRVTLTNDYYLAIYETTQKQCLRVCGDRYSVYVHSEDSDFRPVDAVCCSHIRGSASGVGGTWPDGGHAVGSTSILQKFRDRTGVEVDLPTAAQWEFACRAGTVSALYSGAELSSAYEGNGGELSKLAWYKANSGQASGSNETHEVGTRLPNAWGFYDMYGNVGEYVLDAYYSDVGHYMTGAPEIEPVGATIAESASSEPTYNRYRHTRGSNCKSDAYMCRSAMSGNVDAWYWEAARGGVWGFRMAAPAVVPSTLKGE
jgi:formylglycine-generating enzyme required for sulfatase activity